MVGAYSRSRVHSLDAKIAIEKVFQSNEEELSQTKLELILTNI